MALWRNPLLPRSQMTTYIPEEHVNEDLEIRKELRRLDCRSSLHPLIEEEKIEAEEEENATNRNGTSKMETNPLELKSKH